MRYPATTLAQALSGVDDEMAAKAPLDSREKRLAEALKRNIARRKASKLPVKPSKPEK
jgi:hypothetical protein